MGDFATNSNIEELASFADDLVAILKDPTDVHNLNQCLEHFKTLQSSCDDDFNSVQSSVEDYEKKIKACREKTEEAKANTVADDEMEILEKELEEEVGKGHLLMEEIR
ncbi:uncharacterized protein E5676_scaffold107G00110 [Cucumis melo var. makuwa]|nr:uncharacterized protein E6C27_scaffold141G00230 [Cucumis melo var. makuwa]TYK10931.1 uncharacterized protein E5676_scaffold107G00110 [Cucumis melo var. makuwa]